MIKNSTKPQRQTSSAGFTLRELTVNDESMEKQINGLDTLDAEIIEASFKCLIKLAQEDIKVYAGQKREERTKIVKAMNMVIAYSNNIIENIKLSRELQKSWAAKS